MIRCDIDNASSNELFKFCIINVQMIRRHLEDFLCAEYIYALAVKRSLWHILDKLNL